MSDSISPSSSAVTPPTSRGMLWAGRVLSALAVLFMLMDGGMKVLLHPAAIEGTVTLGYPSLVVRPLGLLQLLLLALYLFPRTSVLGAVLWTGYLGGAIATHVRLLNPLFSHILFPIYVAAFFWGGLWLRDQKLRSILPFRR